MINSGLDTEVYYVSFTGFDTHANQQQKHQNLLSIYSKSLAAFRKDLIKHNKWKDTLVVTFSEFGRRVKENAGRGTDHGAANVVLVTGGAIKKAGFLNEGPDLVNLEKGDLKHSIDFRSVYSTILDKWLISDSRKILGGEFDTLGFI